MLVADVTKRYGCLKAGVDDIKSHRFFKGLDWNELAAKKIKADYVPVISDPGDTSNFTTYPDSPTMSPVVKKDEDPFLDW